MLRILLVCKSLNFTAFFTVVFMWCLYLDINERQKERMKKSLIFFIKILFTSNAFGGVCYSEPCQTSKMEVFVKIVFCKNLHLGCLTRLRICPCITSRFFFFYKKQNFYKKNLTRRQNQIKCISKNTCTESDSVKSLEE